MMLCHNLFFHFVPSYAFICINLNDLIVQRCSIYVISYDHIYVLFRRRQGNGVLYIDGQFLVHVEQ